MIRALAKTPRPYATTLASEIFATGVINSDTDFRQFVEYGNLTGLDMALVQDSYKYHTRLDIPDEIQPGALTHMGHNVISMLEYLTSDKTTLGNSPDAKPLPFSPPSSLIFWTGLGGHLMFVYTRLQATAAYSTLAAIGAVVVADRVDWKHKGVYAGALAGVLVSFVSALIGANAVALFISLVMDKSMTWFRHEAWPILIFGPPAALSIVLVQKAIGSLTRTKGASPAQARIESGLLEHATLVGQVVYYSALTLIGHAAGIGSSYLFATSAFASLVALVLNDYVLKRNSQARELHLATYVIGQVSPLLLGVEGLVGFLDLFVPLTGRMGADAPADVIVASLVVVIGYLSIPMVLPFCHRHGPKAASRLAIGLTFVIAFTLGWFTRPSAPIYDHAHPKRILALHMVNMSTTPPTFDLHIATVDGNPFDDLANVATIGLRATDARPEAVRVSDEMASWDIIYPVSQFLTTYRIPLPQDSAEAYSSPWTDKFAISAAYDVLNAITRTRSLELVLAHDGVMWPVLAFDADVVSWDLPQPAARGRERHHVKSVAGFGVDEFRLKLVVKLDDAEFAAAQRNAQRRKGQRGEEGRDEDEKVGGLRVDFSGLDRTGMWPASGRHYEPGVERKPGMKFFERFEERLPEYVDAMLLSAVGTLARAPGIEGGG